MTARQFAFFALACLTPSGAHAAATQRYCTQDTIYANGDEASPIGTFMAEVTLHLDGNVALVSYFSSMPDSAQDLEFARAHAVSARPAGYKFTFTDNWNNKGSATLTVKGHAAHIVFGSITPPANSGGDNATRGYDDSTLTTAGCRHMQQHFPS